MSKMDPKMGAQTRSFFGHLAPFFCARRPWEPKWLQGPPQEPPRPVQASISIDFGLILDDCLMIFCIMWATFYLVCLITFLVTSFQVQMCWGRPQGSVRSQKSAMWPTFCLACLFVFVTSSPTSQVSGHRFFGIVNRVTSELRSTARWNAGGN